MADIKKVAGMSPRRRPHALLPLRLNMAWRTTGLCSCQTLHEKNMTVTSTSYARHVTHLTFHDTKRHGEDQVQGQWDLTSGGCFRLIGDVATFSSWTVDQSPGLQNDRQTDGHRFTIIQSAVFRGPFRSTNFFIVPRVLAPPAAVAPETGSVTVGCPRVKSASSIMRKQAIVFIVCLALALPFTQGRRRRREDKPKLTLKSSPKLAVEGVTPELKIECHTPQSLHDLMFSFVISLEREDGNDTSTRIAYLGPAGLQSLNDSRVKAEGKIQTSEEGSSYLVVRIEQPVVNDTATYTCKFVYLSRGLLPHILTGKVEVTVTEVAPVNYVPVSSEEQCGCNDVWNEINKIKETLVKDNQLLRSSLQAYDETCKVTFSARFGEKDGNPITAEEVIVFNTAPNNKGGAYDTRTGEFTAPCSGQYFFTVTLRTYQDLDSGYVDGVLQVDNQELARTSTHSNEPRDYYATSSNGLVVSLQKGQKVSVVTRTTSSGAFIGEAYSIFSGFFLYP
ncbi:hypothetical protein Btru_055366 [Bulinus truncatus]|nr:hypothetical protein Btru_055366 [Bulinus truncatus]